MSKKKLDWRGFRRERVLALKGGGLAIVSFTQRTLDKFGWIPADDISSGASLAEADGARTATTG